MKLDTTKAVENNLRPLTLKQTLKSFSNFKEKPFLSRNANEMNNFQRNLINMEKSIRHRRNINRKKNNRRSVKKGNRTIQRQFKTL